eukprot:5733354-Karenia_brevis.AAC.1
MGIARDVPADGQEHGLLSCFTFCVHRISPRLLSPDPGFYDSEACAPLSNLSLRLVLQIELARWGAQSWRRWLLGILLMGIVTPLAFLGALLAALPYSHRVFEFEVLA